MKRSQLLLLGLLEIVAAVVCVAAQEQAHKSMVRDIATVEGVRENPLLGYGLSLIHI